MSYNTLRYEVAENILTLTLNRPDQLNAFTMEMAHELIDAFNRASDDDEVRAVVVTGAGRAFCAGMDLSAGRQCVRPEREAAAHHAGHERTPG